MRRLTVIMSLSLFFNISLAKTQSPDCVDLLNAITATTAFCAGLGGWYVWNSDKDAYCKEGKLICCKKPIDLFHMEQAECFDQISTNTTCGTQIPLCKKNDQSFEFATKSMRWASIGIAAASGLAAFISFFSLALLH